MSELTGHLFINFIIGSPNWQSLLLNWKDILGPKKQHGLIAADHWYLLRVWLWHRCPTRSHSLGTGAREGWWNPALLLRGGQGLLPTCSPRNGLSSAWAEPWQVALPPAQLRCQNNAAHLGWNVKLWALLPSAHLHFWDHPPQAWHCQVCLKYNLLLPRLFMRSEDLFSLTRCLQ